MLVDTMRKLTCRRAVSFCIGVLSIFGVLLASQQVFSANPAKSYDEHQAAFAPIPADASVSGEVLLLGRPAPPNARWSVPVSVTLMSASGDYTLNQAPSTDQSGYFTVTTELSPGNYLWRIKHPQTLANAGSATLVSGTNMIEMGTLSEGDANNDNCVNALDFGILKVAFDKSFPDPFYDARTDFNGDTAVNVGDFNLQKRSFGQCGAAPFPTPTATYTPTLTPSVTPTVGAPCSFLPDNIWNRNIAALPTYALSDNYVASIGVTASLRSDFGSGLYNGEPIGIPYVTVPGLQQFVPITFRYADESNPGPYPIPTNAPIEGGPASTGDRHVIVIDRDSCTLYEVFSAYPHADGSWEAGSGAVWHLSSDDLRPSGWTSADGAGLPILPGLVTYDEVASGRINHALRFTVPRTQRAFLWPARHYASEDADPNLPPMGLRVRLKAAVDISSYPQQVRVILQALKDYGMFLADNGGAWSITGTPDERWDNEILAELRNLHGQDFEAVDESGLMIDRDSGRSR